MRLNMSSDAGSAYRRRLFNHIADQALRVPSSLGGSSQSKRGPSWLFNVKDLFFDPEFLEAVCETFWARYQGLQRLQIGGLATGAIPFVVAALLAGRRMGLDVSGFFVRKERKTVGTYNLIEGSLRDAPIVIVDDILNSSSSFEKVRQALAQTDHTISAAFCVVDFESPRSLEWRRQHRVEVNSLFKLADFGLSVGTAVRDQGGRAPVTLEVPVVWSAPPLAACYSMEIPKSRPMVAGSQVFVGGQDGTFSSFDYRSGTLVWRRQVRGGRKGILSSPLAFEDTVIFGAYDGSVYGLHTADGTTRWQFLAADWVGSSPVLIPTDRTVVIGLEHALPTKPGSIVCLDADSGALRWQQFTGAFVHATGLHIPDKSSIAIGCNDGIVYCFRVGDGSVLWQQRLGGAVKVCGSLSKDGETLFVGSFDHSVYALDTSTGEIRWSFKTGGPIYSESATYNHLVIQGSTDKYLYFLDQLTGTLVKRLHIGGKIFATPVVVNDLLLIGSTTGELLAVNMADFAIVMRTQLPERITTGVTIGPAATDVLAVTYEGTLYRLDLSQVVHACPS